jgi:hypothetical protein
VPPDEFPIGDILAVERDVIPLDGVDVFQRKEIDAIGDRVALAEAEQISRRLRISRTSVPRFLSPRLYAEVWKDGSLAYKIIRIYPVPLIASKSSLKCRSVPMSFGLPTSLMFQPRRRGESERYGIPIVRFLAVMLTALALVPAAAHLFALPNKIGLDSARYFTVQGIYRGWSMFGFMLLGALVANLGLALPAAPPSCALCASPNRFSAHRHDPRGLLHLGLSGQSGDR